MEYSFMVIRMMSPVQGKHFTTESEEVRNFYFPPEMAENK